LYGNEAPGERKLRLKGAGGMPCGVPLRVQPRTSVRGCEGDAHVSKNGRRCVRLRP
jgi:hypothetical protein